MKTALALMLLPIVLTVGALVIGAATIHGAYVETRRWVEDQFEGLNP